MQSLNLAKLDQTSLLLDYQKRWIADDSDFKIAEKTRRCGLTWAEAADNALIASLAKSEAGSDVFYIGTNKEMAREYITAVAHWARVFNYAASEIEAEILDDENKDILAFVIYFASGFKVKALSSNPKNLRGMQGVVVIDEAAFHEQLAEVIKAATALTMWGAKIRIISTHNGVDNLFNEMILDARAGRKKYSVHTITIEDALNDGLFKRICLVNGKNYSKKAEKAWLDELIANTATYEDALEEYYCTPKHGSGLWLSRSLIERQMNINTPILRLNKDASFSLLPEEIRRDEIKDWINEHLKPVIGALKKTDMHFVGEDFGRSSDLTAIVILRRKRDLSAKVVTLIELGNLPYKQQEQILIFVLENIPNFSGAKLDARGNGGYLAEVAFDKFGSLIDCVQLSEKWYRENTPAFKAALEDNNLQDIPKDTAVLSDLRSFQVVKGVPRILDKRVKNIDGKGVRHADTAIALLLAYSACRNDDALIIYPKSAKLRELFNITKGY